MYGHQGNCTVATAKAQGYEDYESAVTAPLPYEDNVLQGQSYIHLCSIHSNLSMIHLETTCGVQGGQ